ncbi:helix-turn-helix domain-containing GNAT family N-acetyltransferase [Mameliella sp. AT18]|uniref:bifunctional helix-turn-helix transcriptional regulator/GNAT family N-acetyltransferase n=1 Tax=Mameliella sp. AT18 TaxID=3028385 RepID=UPI00084105CC|nr:helix-turn-helix domain-containing GNAT family N-acetyltransferase [Mameliella sp. AT18]MDD9729529.1 helix-turn-helix domain-containing GNAT family N-acetyltransferase [Mameliella sp. AT18]ODM50000.1 PadR family transcriptional regulator [Ruegeria sp. PBVC088]
MTIDAIARTRRFHRAVTSEVGALDSSFLGRGRPLGPARVLHAIGNGVSDVAEIRAHLKLDSGLMSRLLRGLEDEGLVTVTASGNDARRRSAALTPAGEVEFAEYEALSDQQAGAILSRHPHPEALLQAMDLVATALGFDRTAIQRVPPSDPRAQQCLATYYGELAQRFSGGFDVNLSADPEARDMEPPRGAFLLAVLDSMAIGCAGLKGTDKGYAEVKRVWVAPSARRMGLAGLLMRAIEDEARGLGIGTLRLDTNSALPEAVRFYRKSGWTEIPRFNDDPYPDVFFEKHL